MSDAPSSAPADRPDKRPPVPPVDKKPAQDAWLAKYDASRQPATDAKKPEVQASVLPPNRSEAPRAATPPAEAGGVSRREGVTDVARTPNRSEAVPAAGVPAETGGVSRREGVTDVAPAQNRSEAPPPEGQRPSASPPAEGEMSRREGATDAGYVPNRSDAPPPASGTPADGGGVSRREGATDTGHVPNRSEVPADSGQPKKVDTPAAGEVRDSRPRYTPTEVPVGRPVSVGPAEVPKDKQGRLDALGRPDPFHKGAVDGAANAATGAINKLDALYQGAEARAAVDKEMPEVNRKLAADPTLGALVIITVVPSDAPWFSLIQPAPRFESVDVYYGRTEADAYRQSASIRPGGRHQSTAVWIPPRKQSP